MNFHAMEHVENLVIVVMVKLIVTMIQMKVIVQVGLYSPPPPFFYLVQIFRFFRNMI